MLKCNEMIDGAAHRDFGEYKVVISPVSRRYQGRTRDDGSENKHAILAFEESGSLHPYDFRMHTSLPF